MRVISLRALRPALVATVLLSLAATGMGVSAAPAGAATAIDGLTPATAAASCWEIKQQNSSAPSRAYWILTPQLKVPTKIYCDQTTDGGGWALVGRGRENWTLAYDGNGTPDQVADVVTGTEAFAPRQLDSDIVTALLGGKRFDDPVYGGGVRLRRALNTAGTDWQETRWTYRAGSRDRWNWSFGAGFPISVATIDGTQITGATTYDFGTDNKFKRVRTYESSNNGYVRGFHYGQQAIGNTSPTSYIYSKASGGQYGTPFTQVFIRPKITSGDLNFPQIPAGGTAAETIRPAPRNGSLPSSWGVTGLGAGGTTENATEVQAFAQIGNRMYVGGNFTTVQKGENASGSDRVSQAYLAAFDATTGDFIRSFTPTLNSQVKALLALPNGKLAVGGEFTRVNGSDRSGLVVLDPNSGALDSTWTTDIENRLTGGKVSIRGLDTDGTYLYLTGALTHMVRPGYSDRFTMGGGRILLSNGVGDSNWNPSFNGTGTAIDVSADNSRVYFSGYFTKARDGVKADRAAAFTTAPGAPRVAQTWQPTFSTAGSARYQQAVKEVGDKVWLGGSQHNMFSYDRTTFALEDAHITRAGGDIQAITGGNGLVFAGCHCGDWNYSGVTNYDTAHPGSTQFEFTQADKVYYVAAYDETTGELAPEWTPTMRARNGLGAWALTVAADGTLWAGGSISSSVKENGSNQWIGGFVRYAPRPSTAPSKPTGLTAALKNGAANVAWNGVAGSDITYEVLRNDRVVATSTSTSVTVPNSSAGDRFFVRAADSWGNRSASTSAVTLAAEPSGTTLLSSGATWSYYFNKATPLPSSWKSADYDDSSWTNGKAPLGWGSSTIETNIDVAPGEDRALTSYHRTTFSIPAGATYGTVTLTTRADDGVAVYVNGTEIGRADLPDGTLTAGTYAQTSRSTAAAIASPVSFTIPVSELRIGTNTVAVEVHSNYYSTGSTSMDARIVATAGNNAPSEGPVGANNVTLVPAGAVWDYVFNKEYAVPADWADPDFDPGIPLPSGPAPLGWGSSGIATNIDTETTSERSLTAYFRRPFTVSDPHALSSVQVTTRADDGIAVYVNGVEIGRSRLPSGTLTQWSYATTSVSTATALASPVTFDVPLSLLQSGGNVIAVEVHSNYRSTGSISMDLTMVGTP